MYLLKSIKLFTEKNKSKIKITESIIAKYFVIFCGMEEIIFCIKGNTNFIPITVITPNKREFCKQILPFRFSFIVVEPNWICLFE